MKAKKTAGRMPKTETQKLEKLKGRVQRRTKELVNTRRALQESEQRYREPDCPKIGQSENTWSRLAG